jgi:hypothetical protein
MGKRRFNRTKFVLLLDGSLFKPPRGEAHSHSHIYISMKCDEIGKVLCFAGVGEFMYLMNMEQRQKLQIE